MLESLQYEFRHALRTLVRRPLFLVVGGLTLALGVAVNVLIFQVANEVLLRPLPVEDPDALVTLGNGWEGLGYDHASLSYPELLDYRRLDVFEGVAGYRGDRFNFTAGAGDPVRLEGLLVTPNLSEVLGIQPVLGRAFEAADGEPGAEAAVLLTDRIFRTRFGGDEALLDSTLEIGGEPHRVVGVLPAGLDFPERTADVWRVARLTPQETEARGWRTWTTYARLAPGISVQEARDAVLANEAVMKEADAWYSTPEWGWVSSVRGVREHLVRDVRPTLLLLLVAVLVVAVVAATNVANLFLSRTSERRRELAVRTAVGASRVRLTGQLLLEALALSVVAGLLGVALARVAAGVLQPMLAARAGLDSLAADWRVATFVFGLCVGLGLVIAAVTVPSALRLARVTTLRGRGEDRSVASTRRLLVVGQLAIALALMVTAGLVLRSLDALTSVDIGFRTEGAAKASVSLDRGRYADADARHGAFDRILEALRSQPGVEAAGLTSILPLTGLSDNSVHILDSATVSRETAVFPQIRIVSEGVFEALGIPLVAGRGLRAGDREGAPGVAVVNLAFANRFFGGEAVGRQFSFGLGDDATVKEIVGVVGNTQEGDLGSEAREVYYLPFRQVRDNGGTGSAILVARAGDETLALAGLRGAVARVDPLQAIDAAEPLSVLRADAAARERARSTLLVAFALLAVLLAAIGVYGVLSFSVQQERRSVGLRLALGALPAQVVGIVVRRGLRLALVGVGIGMLLAVLAARGVQSQLYGVSAFDPAVYSSVVLILLVVAVLASWLPARRASRVDPLVALREE